MNLASQLGNILDKEGKVTGLPRNRVKHLLALKYLASKFEPGKNYTEKEVNETLNRHHNFGNPALLRRELIDNKILSRTDDCRKYWLEIEPESAKG